MGFSRIDLTKLELTPRCKQIN